jgi:hypothetical protein
MPVKEDTWQDGQFLFPGRMEPGRLASEPPAPVLLLKIFLTTYNLRCNILVNKRAGRLLTILRIDQNPFSLRLAPIVQLPIPRSYTQWLKYLPG